MDTGLTNQLQASAVGTNVSVLKQDEELSARKTQSRQDPPKKLAPADKLNSVPVPETSRSVTFEVDKKSNQLYI